MVWCFGCHLVGDFPEVAWLFVQRFRISRNPPGIWREALCWPNKTNRFEWKATRIRSFISDFLCFNWFQRKKSWSCWTLRGFQGQDVHNLDLLLTTCGSLGEASRFSRLPSTIRAFAEHFDLALDRLLPEKHQSLPPWSEGGPDGSMSEILAKKLGSFAWAQQGRRFHFVCIIRDDVGILLQHGWTAHNIRECTFLARCFSHGEAPNV